MDEYLSQTLHYIGLTLYLIHIFSYTYTAFANPGIPKKKNYIEMYGCETKRNLKICDKCNVIMDEEKKTYHCDMCGVCIDGKCKI